MPHENVTFRIAAVSVLYHPKPEFIENFFSYLDEVDLVYAIDNSETEPTAFIKAIRSIDKIKYTPNGENLGIAAALNQAAALAMADKFDLLLTMDQDSSVTDGMLREMLDVCQTMDFSQIAVISPRHLVPHKTIRDKPARYEEVEVTMTSGNLVNLDAYQKIGPFDENLFIDCVDHDFCLRANQSGYKVVIANRAVLMHKLGEPIVRRGFWGRKKVIKSYPSIRKYYRVRNRLYMMEKYRGLFPDYHKASRQAIWQDLKYIVKFEKDKRRKLLMMWRGFKDYQEKKWGRYEP